MRSEGTHKVILPRFKTADALMCLRKSKIFQPQQRRVEEEIDKRKTTNRVPVATAKLWLKFCRERNRYPNTEPSADALYWTS